MSKGMISDAALRTQAPIAYIMSRFPRITETFILREMLELERMGQSVVIFPLLKVQQPVRHAESEQLLERVHYTPFISLPILAANLRYLLRKPSIYSKLLWSVLKGNLGSANLFLGAVGIFPKSVYFAKLIAELGVRHVHAHFATHPALSALIISELTGINFSITVHAHDIFVHKAMLGEKLRKSQFVAAISEFNKRFLLELFPDASENKIRIVRCGINPGQYNSEKHSFVKKLGDSFDILCVGSLQPYKGIEYLIRACGLLREKVPNLKCVVIGEGDDRAMLEKLIDTLELKEIVHLIGARPQNEVTEYLGKADIFVLPSVIASDGQMEGIPVALMEAAATGLPLISTTLSGIPELVFEGENGLLVPPGDEAALADAILSLYQNPSLRRRMGQAGRLYVEREYNLRRNVEKLKSLFDESIQEENALQTSPPVKNGFSEAKFLSEITDRLKSILPEAKDGFKFHGAPLGSGQDSTVYSLTLSAADGATRDVVLKLHRPARFKSETDNASALPYAENEYRALSSLWKNFGAAGGRFRVPQPVLLLSEQQAVVTEKCGGERCDKLLQHQAVGRGVVSRKQVISAVEACGEWLAKFHFVTRRQSDKRHVINRLRKEFAADLASCETFGFDRRLIEKAGRYFEANIETVAGESSSIVSQHCDFGPHNIFVSNDTITVIDFEGMQDGLIYDDLAYFLCLIEVMPFYHLTQTMKREISEAFLRGYEKKSFVNKRQLEFYQLPVMIKIVAHNPVFEKLRGNLHLLRRFYRKRTYTKWLEERVR